MNLKLQNYTQYKNSSKYKTHIKNYFNEISNNQIRKIFEKDILYYKYNEPWKNQ
jgi:hypothetical protein